MRHKSEEFFERIERFINRYQEEYNVTPNTVTISKGTQLSTATVCRYLQQMKADGRIQYEGHRSIVTKETSRGMNTVPVLGPVSCGVPKLAEENIEARVRLPVELFGKGNFYILRANGDSMVDAGIADGDLVLIRQQNTAEPGQIVVALMDDEATLKRFFPEPGNNRIRLHPENSKYPEIYVYQCEIQGVAVKVIKDLL